MYSNSKINSSSLDARALETCFEVLPLMVGIVEITDRDILHVKVSDASARYFGKNREDMKDTWASEFTSQETIDHWLHYYKKAKESGKPQKFRINAPDTEVFDVTVSYVDIGREGKSRFTYLLEKSPQQESENQLKIFANSMTHLAWMANSEGWIYWYNDRWYEFTGLPHGPSTKDDLKVVFHSEDFKIAETSWEHSLNSGDHLEMKCRLKHQKHGYRWNLIRALPIRDQNGSVIRWMGTCTDVHDLERRTADLEALLASSPLGLATFDRDHRYISINEALANINGLPVESHIGRPNEELFPSTAAETNAIIDKVFATKEINQTELVIPRPTNPEESSYWIVGFYPVLIQDRVESVGAYVLEITEQRKAEAELKKAIQARDEFLSIASHELKTPLTSLSLAAQKIQRLLTKNSEFLTAERISHFVSLTDMQVSKLTRLVDDMLDISRIQTGLLRIEKENFDLKELLEDLKTSFDEDLKNKTGSALLLETPNSLIGAWDKMRIEQVFNNLLTNSLRYGNKKPVQVVLKQVGGFAHVLVIDQGIGINSEDTNKIFDRFVRVISANEVSGLGLGLFITKQIVLSHGGEIWVESEIGKGSTFHVKLPV